MPTNAPARCPSLHPLAAAVLAAVLAPVLQLGAAGSTKLDEYRSTFARESAKIETNRVAVLAADAGYLRALETLQAGFRAQGDLDNVTAVIAERKRFESCKLVPETPPADLPPSIAKAQADYRAVLAQGEAERAQRMAVLLRSYTAALRAYIKVLLDQDKMDEARPVNVEMKRAEAELAGLEASSAHPALPTEPAATPVAVPGTATTTAARALAPDVRRGLVLHYAFDKDEGAKVTDRSGKGNGGTVHNARWTAHGKSGGAYEFNGRDSYIDAGTSAGLNPRDAFTFAAWVKPAAGGRSPTGCGAVLARWDTVGGVNQRTYVLEVVQGAMSPRVTVSADGTDGGAAAVTERQSLEADAWSFLCVTCNGSRIRLFRDGTPVGDVPVAGIARSPGTRTGIGAVLGRPNDYAISPFQGVIDEIMFWNRALSADEIARLHGQPQ